jgi:hypothetical protein
VVNVASCQPCPLYCKGKKPRCPLNRRLGGLQVWSGCFGEENSVATAGSQILDKPVQGSTPGSGKRVFSKYRMIALIKLCYQILPSDFLL